MKIKLAGIILLLTFVCNGCALEKFTDKPAVQTEDNTYDTGYTKASVGNYDSADTAVIVKKNESEKTITLMNSVKGRNYTLKYDGTTAIYDKYKQPIALAQIVPGDIVDVTFMKMQKRLNSIKLSENAWVYENVDKFEIGNNNKSITIGQEEYKLDENAAVLSNGEQAELMELNARDTLIVKGIDRTVYSIEVGKGHGYLRLVNDEYFIGGWIEVGQALIQPVTEGMLLAVPEGTYQVLLTNKGIEGKKEVTIQRDGEVELDVGDVKAEEAKYGKIIFSLSPSQASLYIDGDKIDSIDMVSLEYGIHQMIVKADGYKTITQYLKVGQELASIDIELEIIEDEVKNDDTDVIQVPGVSANTLSSNNTVNTVPNISGTSGSKVFVDAPSGAEVYVDGVYVGVSPVNFAKKAGSHIIILRKSGFQTKSYTIQLDSEIKDISYSFADLVQQ